VDLKSLFFNTVSIWTTTFVAYLVLHFHDFLDLFPPS
jgi:hypothetical protein